MNSWQGKGRQSMRICVFGAGAVGGAVAAYMANAGLDVTLIARGAMLAAVRDKGLILRRREDEIVTRPKVTNDTVGAGVQDIVITTLKVPAIRGALDSLKALIGPETTVVIPLPGPASGSSWQSTTK